MGMNSTASAKYCTVLAVVVEQMAPPNADWGSVAGLLYHTVRTIHQLPTYWVPYCAEIGAPLITTRCQ
jgi:hypothetical protein